MRWQQRKNDRQHRLTGVEKECIFACFLEENIKKNSVELKR
jgi:hypothetical protein